jgi:PPOX class probable F420-dependent enzyme
VTPDDVAFLHGRRVAHLGTVDERGRPHVVPVCFVCLDGRVYTPIDEKPKRGVPSELRRVRNLLANPEVCFTADVYDEDWRRLAWLQLRGRAALVDDAAERAGASAALRARYAQYGTMALEERPLIRIDPRRIVRWSATA